MNCTKVVFVVVGSEGYGVGRVWDVLFHALIDSGYHITIAVLDREYLSKWKERYSRAFVVAPPFLWHPTVTSAIGVTNYWGIFKRGISQLRLISWLSRAEFSTDLSAVILQGPIETFLCSSFALNAGIPAFWFVPNVISSDKFFNFNRRIYRILIHFANLIPVSNSYFTDSTFGRGDFRRHVVHLGVDTSKFAPVQQDFEIRERLCIPKSAVVIGIFARMSPAKGHMRLIQALATLKPEIHVLICGGPAEGMYFDALVAEVENLNLFERVHFQGVQGDLRPFYGACDLIGNFLAQPEGFGLTVVEAMACGKPVLAHYLGGPSEIVVDGITGWLIPSCDVDSIAAGLLRALDDRHRWSEMGNEGRARAVAKFSMQIFEEEIRSVLEAEIKSFSVRVQKTSFYKRASSAPIYLITDLVQRVLYRVIRLMRFKP